MRYLWVIVTAVLIIAILIWGLATNWGRGKVQSSTTQSQEQPLPEALKPVETQSVSTKDFEFTPEVIQVKKGTTVTWTNDGKASHTVTSEIGLFNSGPIEPGKTYQYTFENVGKYFYYCIPHANQMGGEVIVIE